MPEGNDTYKGLAVPLYGESEIKQVVAANDMVTLTGVSGQTGDFLVCQDLDGNEKFYVHESGRLGLAGFVTTAPTTGLTKGELVVYFKANSAPVLGMCVSSATNKIKYISPFDTLTAGRTT